MSSLAVARASTTSGTVGRLRALLAASLIVPAMLYAVAAWQERRLLLDEAARRAEKTAEVLEQHAAAAFHAYELIFARLDEHLRAAPGEDEAGRHAYLAGIDHDQGEIGSLFLVDAKGRVTAHSRFYPVVPSSILDRDYFRTLAIAGGVAAGPLANAAPLPVLDASGLAVGAPVTGRFSGTPKLNIARSVTDTDGRFAGAVAISVSQDYFEAFARTLSTSPDDSLALVRADGTVLARSPALSAAQLLELQTSERTRFLSTAFAGGPRFRISPLDRVERIITFRKLANYPIYVSYGLGTAAVLAAWRVHLLLYGAVTLLAALTLAGVTWFAMRGAEEEGRVRASLIAEMARREAAESALRQAQKMEAIGQLTGGIAHDFNNLLAAVLGNLELLAKRLPDDPRMRRQITGAIEGARRGAALTQRMLAFSRRQELTPDTVDIEALVDGMANLLVRSIGSAITVETRFPARLALARVDANQLETSLLNLVVNARDAMQGSGTIVIGGRNETVDRDDPPGLSSGRYVVLTVTDTGEGMDAATVARATEPFFTTKPVGKGTGLGLAMVHGTMSQSGGALRIESAPGHGTTVELWLPMAEHVAEQVVTAPPQRPRTTARGLDILLVDDDALVLAGTSAMLDDLGHRVIEAASAQDALATLRGETTVDLVLTDQVMPGVTGLELAEEVRRLRPRLPVMLASGYAELSGPEALRLPRLRKPFTQAELAEAVADATAPAALGRYVGQRADDDATWIHGTQQDARPPGRGQGPRPGGALLLQGTLPRCGASAGSDVERGPSSG